ncbi:MAG: phosphoribosylformylglycinamidine synthase I [Lentisphaeria bacterium]|nr:phosphoribosylformylglycinamidine synthase I [Lentisphaeria bacterium]NQZ70285.1 phosphoribosylformylglycinamidine synthase I [Lentisphaeria bacterium]
MSVKALIITGFGLNCQKETAIAFEQAGAEVSQVHLTDLADDHSIIHQHQILVFIGGFSFGDHLGAGTVFASRLKYQIGDELKRFIDDGKLIIGICNGFQTMARLGLVPAVDDQFFVVQAALAQNNSNVFRDDWVNLTANPESPCIFTKGCDSIELPIRHGEGKFVTLNDEILDKLEANNQVALRYADASGKATKRFPANPNGSTNAIAGICDPSGRIFGLMPHPEAFLSPYNHPQWTRNKITAGLPEKGAGTIIFENAVAYAEENLI